MLGAPFKMLEILKDECWPTKSDRSSEYGKCPANVKSDKPFLISLSD